MMKKCINCGTDFEIKKRKNSSNFCSKKCVNRNYVILNLYKIRELNKNWRKENYEKFRKNDRKWRKEYQKIDEIKEKIKIRDFARYYLRDRIFKRDKNKCVKCGTDKGLELHHKDYTIKEKDIVTICRKCHLKIHLRQKFLHQIKKECLELKKKINRNVKGREAFFREAFLNEQIVEVEK